MSWPFQVVGDCRQTGAMMPGRLSALVALMVAATSWPWPARGGDAIRVSGTGTALGTLRLLASAYEKAHPGQVVHLLPSVGSAGGIKAVGDGALDLAVSGRELLPAERGHGLVARPFARTAFAFAAGPRAAVDDLTPALLARIFRGESTVWPDGERIRLVLRPRNDADTLFIRSLSPELDAAVELALARDGMVMATTNQDCNETLARTPGSIGPSSLTQLMTEPVGLRPLSWNGVMPNLKNLSSGAYPLVKPLLLVVRAPLSGKVRSFLEYLATPEAGRILEQTGNLPVAMAPIP
jgi:phosphate transport system substrate-binding protein